MQINDTHAPHASLPNQHTHTHTHTHTLYPTNSNKTHDTQERLLRDLPSVFRTVLKQHHLAPGDFPDLDHFR